MTDKLHPEEIKTAFNYSIPLQVRFSDIDGYMHVNNGVFFNYMEHARALYLHQVCQWDFSKIGAVVANINMNFYAPINFFDELHAYVRCVRIGTTSFTLEQVLMGDKNKGEAIVFAKALITMVTVDMSNMKPSSLPDDYVAKIRRQDPLVA